ncbi:MAG: hypothetical protein PHE55_22020 [Methylococcaceae bacterium]|nr:hypothetical protein [Methylococcaceae bacterium]
MSVKETDDQRVLIHCFAGCAVDDIVSAVGLDLSNLFPSKHGSDFDASAPRKPVPRFRAADLLELAALEARICAIAACDMARGIVLSASDAARVGVAAEALYSMVQECSYAKS